MLFPTFKKKYLGNIEKCPFTYWLLVNGRWFLQIVDREFPQIVDRDILHSLVLIFYPGGCQFLFIEKQYFLISLFYSRLMLFPTFLEKIKFRGGGGVSKKLCCLLLNMLAGDLGRPSCLVKLSLYLCQFT